MAGLLRYFYTECLFQLEKQTVIEILEEEFNQETVELSMKLENLGNHVKEALKTILKGIEIPKDEERFHFMLDEVASERFTEHLWFKM